MLYQVRAIPTRAGLPAGWLWRGRIVRRREAAAIYSSPSAAAKAARRSIDGYRLQPVAMGADLLPPLAPGLTGPDCPHPEP